MLYILIGASITLTLIGIFIVLWLILTGHSPILLEIAIGVIGGSQVVNTSLVAFFIKSLYSFFDGHGGQFCVRGNSARVSFL